MSPTQCMGHIYTKKLFTVYLKFKFNFLYFHLLNLRNLDMWLMDSGRWLTGLWAPVFNPFYFIPSSDFCVPFPP